VLKRLHLGAGGAGLLLLAASAVLALLAVAPASAGTATKLTSKERKAVDLSSVEVLGEESLGILVRAEFAGNITKAIGRGHLRKARVVLTLQPASPALGPAQLTTKGPGVIGKTVAQTSSAEVGVVRDGRALTFFDFGPGFANVGTAEVRVLAPGTAHAVASGDTVGDGSGPVTVPKAELSCGDLTNELAKVETALKAAREAKAKAESLLKGVESLLKELDNGALVNKVVSLIQKFENWKYSVEQTTTDEGVANLKKSRDDIKKQIKEVNATIDDLEAQRQKIKDKLSKCSAPVIKSFSAAFGAPATCSTCTLYTVTATDPGGLPLSYSWSKAVPPGGDPTQTNCGTFTPNSPAANQAVWDHPNSGASPCSHAAGEHPGNITVVVTDTQGLKASFTDTQGSAPYTFP
jgi:prefoldin subunit 5